MVVGLISVVEIVGKKQKGRIRMRFKLDLIFWFGLITPILGLIAIMWIILQ